MSRHSYITDYLEPVLYQIELTLIQISRIKRQTQTPFNTIKMANIS